MDQSNSPLRPTDKRAQGKMLIEQFLLRVDDGWILRKARFYRGAFQEEGERRGAHKLLVTMTEDHDWLGYRFLALRTAAKFLRHGQENASIQEVRQLSASLSDRDPKFKTVRNKIHGSPEPSDATTVRNFLNANNSSVLATDFERLALSIDEVYATDIDVHLVSLAKASVNSDDVPEVVRKAAAALNGASDPQDRFRLLAALLYDLRERLTAPNGPQLRMHIIDTSLVIESELFPSPHT
jgi:hypothetical protein